MGSSGAVAKAVRRLDALPDLSVPLPPPIAVGNDLRGDHPGFPLHARAREAALAAVDRGETRYVDGAGILSLREAVAGELRRSGIHVDHQEGLIITAGEQEARFLALQALAVAEVRRLVLPTVVHPGARKAAALSGLERGLVPLDLTTGAPDPAAVRVALAAGGPTALYVESPNRFTGKIVEPGLVRALADEARRANATIVWDASIASWIPEGVPYLTPAMTADEGQSVITLGMAWPRAGVEGWMVGYLVLPPTVYPPARRLKQVMALCTSVPVQWGVLGVLREGGHDPAADLRALAEVKAAATRVWTGTVFPGEAVSVLAVGWPDEVPAPSRVRGMPGTAFGAPDAIRFTVTATGEVVRALQDLQTGGGA
jgi:aspartate/methionine/tyrosine aminotransferase